MNIQDASLKVMKHLEIMMCTSCNGKIACKGQVLECQCCQKQFPIAKNIINFLPEVPVLTGKYQPGLGQRMMENKLFLKNYEKFGRKIFIRFMGQNWNSKLDYSLEDNYISERFQVKEGPCLDLACGAGRWTSILAQIVGERNVIGFDLAFNILEICSKILPEVLLIRGNALALPFNDNSLEGVNCSNSLQLIPNPQKAILEIGRCLKNDGIFTCFTYLKSDTYYSVIQNMWAKFLNVRPFTFEEINKWLQNANLKIIDNKTINLGIMFTAKKYKGI